MSFQNTVIALLTIAIFSVAAHEMRDQVRAAEHRADCEHEHSDAPASAAHDVRIARVNRAVLVGAISDGPRLASLLGLESRGTLAEQRSLAAVAYGDASHAVMRVRENGRVVQLVVLAE